MIKVLTAAFSVMLLLTAANVQAQREKQSVVKERSVSKTYPAASNKLWIENTFGNVKVITWDRNEIKVDIHIEVSSDKEDVAQKRFDAITIEDKQSGGDVNFKTVLGKDNQSCNNCKTNMYIDYEVRMPAATALSIENTFGHTELPNLTGVITLTNKFGNINAGDLPKLKKLTLEFGEANLKSVANINGVFKFSKVTIDNLSGDNDLQFEFCDYTKLSLDKNLTALDVKESYSHVNLRPASGLSASYSIKTSFGTVTDRSNINIKRTDTPDRYGPDADREYAGQTGSGSTRISVRSSFGRIIIGEATADDMKKEEGQKGQKSKKRDV